MKKLAIAGASVALAAMPVVGVFAASGDQQSVVDTITLNVDSTCSIGSTSAKVGAGKTFDGGTVAAGSTTTWNPDATDGGTIYVLCNSTSGWNIKAVGYTSNTAGTTVMDAAGTGTDIATGIATSGDTSNWSMKVADGNTSGTIVPAYATWAAVPSTAARVAYSDAGINEKYIYTGYQVYVTGSQEADTYTGKVQYTVAPGVGE